MQLKTTIVSPLAVFRAVLAFTVAVSFLLFSLSSIAADSKGTSKAKVKQPPAFQPGLTVDYSYGQNIMNNNKEEDDTSSTVKLFPGLTLYENHSLEAEADFFYDHTNEKYSQSDIFAYYSYWGWTKKDLITFAPYIFVGYPASEKSQYEGMMSAMRVAGLVHFQPPVKFLKGWSLAQMVSYRKNFHDNPIDEEGLVDEAGENLAVPISYSTSSVTDILFSGKRLAFQFRFLHTNRYHYSGARTESYEIFQEFGWKLNKMWTLQAGHVNAGSPHQEDGSYQIKAYDEKTSVFYSGFKFSI